MNDIVIKLREARGLSGLSQKQVAKKTGIGEKSISSWESGARIGTLKLVQLEKLLACYGMTFQDFFGGKFEVFVAESAEPVLPEAEAISRELRSFPTPTRTALFQRFMDMIQGVVLAIH